MLAVRDTRTDPRNGPVRTVIETSNTRRPFRVCMYARHHPLARTRPLDCLAQVAFRLRSCGSYGAILLETLSSECGF